MFLRQSVCKRTELLLRFRLQKKQIGEVLRTLVIQSTEQTLRGCLKITAVGGSVFFIRKDYLRVVQADSVVEGAEFVEGEEQDLLDAGLAFAAETKACDYLARAEQSRAGLERKLLAKKFDAASVGRALDFLESQNYLSDARFSRAWLRNRNVSRAEGRVRLASGLLQRGIDRKTAEDALDEFCAETTEKHRLERALSKIMRLSKSASLPSEKIVLKLVRLGFAYKDSVAAVKYFEKTNGATQDKDTQDT